MRKYISLLILICSLNIYAAELPPAPQPEALQDAIRTFIDTHVERNSKSYWNMQRSYWLGDYNAWSVVLNIPFRCDSKDPELTAVMDAFIKDERNSYQYVHEVPGSGMLYSVSLDSKSNRREITRKSKDQEFYMLCAKNYDNPRFRDMYSISYVKKKEGKKEMYEGNIYHIHSPRPDYKDGELLETPQYKKFILIGYLDSELLDSCKSVAVKGKRGSGRVDYEWWNERVIDGRFVYSKQLTKAMDIQVFYHYEDKTNSAAQTINATPGTTLYVDFHKNGYEIKRVETDYSDDENSDYKQKMTKTDETLKNYSIMLKSINEQIRELRETPEDAPDHSDVKKRLSDLHKRARDITKKMQDMVEKMESELK